MSDATTARVIGTLFAVAGVALSAISWVNDWSLFQPFAAVLLIAAIWFQMLAWSWRRRRT